MVQPCASATVCAQLGWGRCDPDAWVPWGALAGQLGVTAGAAVRRLWGSCGASGTRRPVFPGGRGQAHRPAIPWGAPAGQPWGRAGAVLVGQM